LNGEGVRGGVEASERPGRARRGPRVRHGHCLHRDDPQGWLEAIAGLSV